MKRKGKKQPPVKFDRLKEAVFSDAPGIVRMSTAARLLREAGNEAGAAELERDAKAAASWCPQCERKLEDPAIGLVPGRVAFACPWCSGPEVLALWEADGKSQG